MTLSPRQRAFFMIAVCYRPKDADALFAFAPKDEAQALGALFSELKDKRPEDVRAVAASELKRLARPRNLHYLAEVHDDWVADALKDEPPFVVATVLRYLPAERVNGVLERLPAALLARLPKLSDTCFADARLADLLQRRFESLFALEAVPDASRPFVFEHLPLLKAAQIRGVFSELGYREIALGLAALPQATKSMVLGRLLPEDRAKVENFAAKAADVPGQRAKRAQVHMISKEVDPRRPDFFVRELGFLIYAKALLARDLDDLPTLKKKMPMNEAEALQVAVDQYLPNNSEASVLPYREDVLAATRHVLTGGKA